MDTMHSRFFNENADHPTDKTFSVLGFSIKSRSMHVPFFILSWKLFFRLCMYAYSIFWSIGRRHRSNLALERPKLTQMLWLQLLDRRDQRVHWLHRLPHHEERKSISMNFLKCLCMPLNYKFFYRKSMKLKSC